MIEPRTQYQLEDLSKIHRMAIIWHKDLTKRLPKGQVKQNNKISGSQGINMLSQSL